MSVYIIYTEVVLCTGSSMYICPNSLLYIQGEVVQFSKSIMLCRSAVGDHVSLVALRPIPFLLIDIHTLQNKLVSVFISKLSTLTVTVFGLYFYI